MHVHRNRVVAASSTRPVPGRSRAASWAAARMAVRQSVVDSGRPQARRPTVSAAAATRAAAPANTGAPGRPAPAGATSAATRARATGRGQQAVQGFTELGWRDAVGSRSSRGERLGVDDGLSGGWARLALQGSDDMLPTG